MTGTARTLIALALTAAAAQPAAAQEGFLDRLFGGGRATTPPNPFASNYPSRPPSAEVVRERRARRDSGDAASPGGHPVPPGRVPE